MTREEILAPRPMTTEQIADLVERAKLNEIRTNINAAMRGARARSIKAHLSYRMTPCRIAAHYAKLTGCSYRIAAIDLRKLTKLRCSTGGVAHAFRRIYRDAARFDTKLKLTREQWEAEQAVRP